jgi:glycosyltransferase involved in cell wall biosynthesis/FMN phosphatase YigB (HAD superfamily)
METYETPIISVIVPFYNTSDKFLKRCLDSLLNQTLKEIEIICVNDGSTNNSVRVVKQYAKEKTNIVFVDHKANIGLFHARLSGIKQAKGKYIAFLDSDDYVCIDYYRLSIAAMAKHNADVAVNSIVEDYGKEKIIHNFAVNDMKINTLEGSEILNSFFKQEGLNYHWSVLCNKVLKKDLWNKALPYLLLQDKHLTMGEDIVFSSILLSFADRMLYVKNNVYFYTKHGANIVSDNKTYKQQIKDIDDITTTFAFVEEFINKQNLHKKYQHNFQNWKLLYRQIYIYKVKVARYSKREENKLYERINLFCSVDKEIANNGYFYSVSTTWNDNYEKIKRTICDPKIKVISFDVFDTLVVRPFLEPMDLFRMLDDDFRSLYDKSTFIDFSVLRIESEKKAREKVCKSPKVEDITLDEIYNTLQEEYRVSKNIVDRMKQLEIDAEFRFCRVRKAAFELYEMAVYLGKEIICISDMYLPEVVISKILEGNGYTQIKKIYVSSEVRLNKMNSLFHFVVNDLGLRPTEILHIGDNEEADYLRAKKAGLKSVYFPKTKDVFFNSKTSGSLGKIFSNQLPFWQMNKDTLNFIGMRIFVALIVNNYFDNPFCTFNKNTDFNHDPSFVGYSALGVYVFGIVMWLIDNFMGKKYDKILFVARDGYMPMEVYKILKCFYSGLPDEEYFYISRQSSIPMSVHTKLDFYKLHELIIFYNRTPLQLVPYLKKLFNVDKQKLYDVCKASGFDANTIITNISQWHTFINICIDNFYNEHEHKEKLDKLKEYFIQIFSGDICMFDVGYSAKPEMYLGKLCNKSIDTYFVNADIAGDAQKHLNISNSKLSTFYDYIPSIYGYIEEIFFSKMEGSCAAYNISSQGVVTTMFEKYMISYPEFFVINKGQQATLSFIKDLTSIFGDKIHKFGLPKYYFSLFFNTLFFSATKEDKKMFNCFDFEDAIASGGFSLLYKWNSNLKASHQKSMQELYSFAEKKPLNYQVKKFFIHLLCSTILLKKLRKTLRRRLINFIDRI